MPELELFDLSGTSADANIHSPHGSSSDITNMASEHASQCDVEQNEDGLNTTSAPDGILQTTEPSDDIRSSTAQHEGHGREIDVGFSISDTQDVSSLPILNNHDTFAHVRNVAHLEAMPEFRDARTRQEAFRQIGEQVSQADFAQFQADKRALDAACRIFGQHQISARDGNRWKCRGMQTTLLPHQVLGVAFMLRREIEGHRGGILADHMGLGKTVMALALITNIQPRKPKESLPTLIIAKKSLVQQWYHEIREHCEPEHGLRGHGIGPCCIYSRAAYPDDSPVALELQSHNIVIATPHALRDSFSRSQRPQHGGIGGTLHRIHFQRVVIDEAHEFRNPESKSLQAALALVTKHMWCLTGTAAVNGIYDIYGLLKLVSIDPGISYNKFKAMFSDLNTPNVAEKYDDIVQGCILRRTFAHTLFGARILTLPPMSGTKVTVHFTGVEAEIYKIFQKRFVTKVRAMPDAMSKECRASAWAMVIRLRQLTAHPLVIHDTISEVLELEDLQALRKLANDTIRQQNQSGKTVILRLIKLVSRQLQSHSSSRETAHPSSATSDVGSTDVDAPDARLPSASNTGRKYGLRQRFQRYLDGVIAQHGVNVAAEILKCVYCGRQAVEPQITDCQHIYCESCLHEAMMEASENYGAAARCEECHSEFATTEALGDVHLARLNSKKRKRITSKNILSADIRTVFGEDPMFIPSAKTIAVKAAIVAYLEQEPDCKIVVFSQWLMMLRLLQEMCLSERWGCRLYHGKMSGNARSKVVEAFNADAGVKVLLCSLRAGGLGLNLTAANHIICIDPWFNNAIENQAFGRVYRIGQTRATSMVTLTARDTVDEFLEDIKLRKQTLINNVHSTEKLVGCLTKQDYLTILGHDDVGLEDSDDMEVDVSDSGIATE